MNARCKHDVGCSRFSLFTRASYYSVVAVMAGLLFVSTAAPVRAQCGGTPDCPVSPVPLNPPSSTEINPGGNFFVYDTGAPGQICATTTNEIVGADVLAVGVITTEITLFTSPGPGDTPGPPTIEVFDTISATPATPAVFTLSGATATPAPVAAPTTLMCAGVECASSPSLAVGQSIAITNSTIATVSGMILKEAALPTGSTPVSAAGIFQCKTPGPFTLAVETTAPSIEILSGGLTSIPVPAPIIFPSDSFSDGTLSGVAIYTATTVYGIDFATAPLALVVMGTAPATTTFVSKAMTATSTTITDSAGGTFSVPFPAGVQVVEFGSCVAPLDSCTAAGLTPSGSNIAMNIPPVCTATAAGHTATWPPPLTACSIQTPTVSEWGLVVMTLLCMAAGTIMYGRWRRVKAAA